MALKLSKDCSDVTMLEASMLLVLANLSPGSSLAAALMAAASIWALALSSPPPSRTE